MKKMGTRENKLLHGLTIVFPIAVIILTIALVILDFRHSQQDRHKTGYPW